MMQTRAAVAPAGEGRKPAIWMLAVASLRAHLLILLLPLTFLAIASVTISGLDDPQRAPFISLAKAMVMISLPTALVVMFFVRLYQCAVILKPDSFIRQIGRDLRYLATTPRLHINALPAVAAMLIHNKAAIEMKAAIPAVNPFSWDTTFMALDRMLHFGIDPWRLLHPLLGYPAVTFAINILYNFWFVLMFGLWFWFAYQERHSQLRDRFFFSFSLVWLVGGGIMAMAFSSAGPCYYSLIGLSPDPYSELMGYLRGVDQSFAPIWALNAQAALWDGYTGVDENFLGISAFPSMHNAVIVLFACAAWQVNRRFGQFVAAWAFCILIGSVHLGWHYAVDSYAGVALGLAGWWASGYVARWHEHQPWVAEYKEKLAAA